MAWAQCKWCETKLNGYENMTTHTRDIHPKEHARATLEWAVQSAQRNVTYHSEQLAERVEYERFLAEHSDYPLVRKVVERALVYINYPIEHILEYLAYAQRDLDKALTALIAFDAEHPELAHTAR